MNAHECLCEEVIPDYKISISKLDTELWRKYVSGDLEEVFKYRHDELPSDEFWSYNFILLCLIHVMEGGTFDD